MTSLSPGVLFSTSGLNRMSTPTAPDTTPVEMEKMHKKEPYNGNPWPRDSPVAMVYDVGNSSTSMILLNNKSRSNSRLRGQGPLSRGSVNEFGEAEVNPDRHFSQSNINRDYHNPCLKSTSPYFEPETQPRVAWKNKSQRPPWKPCESSVNAYRHLSCRQPTDPIYYSLENQRPSTTPGGRRSARGPRAIQSNYYLHHPDLSLGQRLYLWSTAHVYSLTDMKSLKQKQYLDLLRREKNRGFHSDKEYAQYDRFIRTPRRLTSEDYYKGRERSLSRARTAHARLQRDSAKENEAPERKEEESPDDKKSARASSAKNVSFDGKKKEGEKESDRGTTGVKRESKSAGSKRSSAKGSRSSSRASRASRDKVSKKSSEDELVLSSDPDTRDKRGEGPTHVNVDVASTNPSTTLSQEPIDREPKDADKLEY